MARILPTRILPIEIPRDPHHAELLRIGALLPLDDWAQHFWMPGIGFHRALFYLSTNWLGWVDCGKQVFEVDPNLQKALAETSLESVVAEDIKSPRQTIWMSFPDSDLKAWGGGKTGWHKVVGAFVSVEVGFRKYYDSELKAFRSLSVENDAGALNIMVWGEENEKSQGVGDDAISWVTVDLQEMREQGPDLESYLKQLLSDNSRNDTLDGLSEFAKQMSFRTELPKGAQEGVFRHQMQKIVRVIVNTLLYLNSQNPRVELDPESIAQAERIEKMRDSYTRVKSTGKQRRMERKIHKAYAKAVWTLRVGKGTEAPTSRNPGATSASESSGSPFWVRGHWWPRKRTIRERISEQESQVAKAENESSVAARELREASKATGGLTLSALRAQAALEKAEEGLAEAKNKYAQKLRWVEPYRKNKGEDLEGEDR